MFGDRKILYKALNINHRNQVLKSVSNLCSLVATDLNTSKGIGVCVPRSDKSKSRF